MVPGNARTARSPKRTRVRGDVALAAAGHSRYNRAKPPRAGLALRRHLPVEQVDGMPRRAPLWVNSSWKARPHFSIAAGTRRCRPEAVLMIRSRPTASNPYPSAARAPSVANPWPHTDEQCRSQPTSDLVRAGPAGRLVPRSAPASRRSPCRIPPTAQTHGPATGAGSARTRRRCALAARGGHRRSRNRATALAVQGDQPLQGRRPASVAAAVGPSRARSLRSCSEGPTHPCQTRPDTSECGACGGWRSGGTR